MFPLIPFTHHWTTIYRPIAENGALTDDQRFRCIESIARLANLSKDLPTLPTPFVAMETNISGDISDKFFNPEYNIYFFVRAAEKLSSDSDIIDTQAKEEAMSHAIEYLNYIRSEQDKHADDRTFPLLGLDLSNIHFETFGPFFDRWFCVGLALTETAPISKCPSPDLYL